MIASLKHRVKTLAFATLFLSAATAHAAPITYGIDFEGSFTDISGTITTDGTLGTFNSRGDFMGIVTGINLTVVGEYQIVGNFVTAVFDTVVTTAGGADFDFQVTENTILLSRVRTRRGGSGFLHSGFSSSSSSSLQFSSTGMIFNLPGGGFTREDGLSSLTFTAQAAAPIPLPAAAPLLGSVLAGMGVLGRRKRRGAMVDKGVTS